MQATQCHIAASSANELQASQNLLRGEMHTTEAGKGIDVLFCSGAFLTIVVVPVGVSFEDRGMRNDSHDVEAWRFRGMQRCFSAFDRCYSAWCRSTLRM